MVSYSFTWTGLICTWGCGMFWWDLHYTSYTDFYFPTHQKANPRRLQVTSAQGWQLGLPMADFMKYWHDSTKAKPLREIRLGFSEIAPWIFMKTKEAQILIVLYKNTRLGHYYVGFVITNQSCFTKKKKKNDNCVSAPLTDLDGSKTGTYILRGQRCHWQQRLRCSSSVWCLLSLSCCWWTHTGPGASLWSVKRSIKQILGIRTTGRP